MTSSTHHHDTVNTSPLRPDASPIFVCRTPKDHRPSPILKVHRQLLAYVSPINPRIFPDASPNIQRCIGDTLQRVPEGLSIHRAWVFSWDHTYIGTQRYQNMSFSSQYIARHFSPLWTVALADGRHVSPPLCLRLNMAQNAALERLYRRL